MYTLFEWVICSVCGNTLRFSTLPTGSPKGAGRFYSVHVKSCDWKNLANIMVDKRPKLHDKNLDTIQFRIYSFSCDCEDLLRLYRTTLVEEINMEWRLWQSVKIIGKVWIGHRTVGI